MNAKITRVSKQVRALLEDEEFIVSDRDREMLEDCYLTLERIAIKRQIIERDIILKTATDSLLGMSANPVGTPL